MRSSPAHRSLDGSSTARRRHALCALSLGCAISLLHGCGDGKDGGSGGGAGASGAAGTSLAGIASGGFSGSIAAAAGVAGSVAATAGAAGSVAPAGGAPPASSGAGGASAGQVTVNGGAGSGAGAPTSGGAGSAGLAGVAGVGGNQGAAGGPVGSGGTANAGRGGIPIGGGSSGAGTNSGGASSGAGGSGGGPAHVGAWRVMHFGDSITETTCQSILTWQKLRDANRTNFDLVGSRQNQQSCNVSNPDRDCEGHGGYLVTDLVGNGKYASQLPQWLAADRAEIVLMHFGTNDVWNNIAPPAILSAYTSVVGALRQVNPNVIIFVAQIIPMNPSGCADCAGRVTALNAQIPAWATAQSSAASPILVVDQWTGFNVASDTGDGVHPNLAGSQKMADKWAAALIARNLF